MPVRGAMIAKVARRNKADIWFDSINEEQTMTRILSRVTQPLAFETNAMLPITIACAM
jgi:hypothetical protein